MFNTTETGTLIKFIREFEELSQREFASVIGISQTALALLETGKNQPSIETLTKIYKVYEIPPFLIRFIVIGAELSKYKPFRSIFPDFEKDARGLLVYYLDKARKIRKFSN